MPLSKRLVAALFAAVLLLLPVPARAQDATDSAASPLIYGDCTKIQVPTSWTVQERWVWTKICAGDVADLHAFAGGSADAADWENWPQKREISFDFLRTILFVEPYQSAIPRAGVRISGARFHDPIDLSYASLARDLWLDNARFDQDVALERVHIPGILSFEGSRFYGGLDLYNLSIGGDLYLRGAFISRTLDLTAARVGGNAELSDIMVAKKLSMYQFHSERDLYMDHIVTLADVDLQAASTGGFLSMMGTTIMGDATMEAIQVNGSVVAKGLRAGTRDATGKASGGDINFHAAQAKGNVEFTDAHGEGMLEISDAIISRDLWLDGGQFRAIELEGASVAGDMNLTKARIGRNLRMNRLHLERDLTMDELVALGDVDMQSATIGGYVSMSAGGILGELGMQTIEVGGSLYAQKLHVGVVDIAGKPHGGDIDLHAGQIRGYAEFTAAQVENRMDMSNAAIGRDLLLDGDGRFSDIALTGAHVGGSILFAQGQFGGVVDCTDASVGRDLIASDSLRFLDRLTLSSVHTGGSIVLKSGTFDGKVIINDAVVGQELQIGQDPGEVGKAGPRIEFHNTVELKRARITGNARIVGAVFKFVGNSNAAAMSQELEVDMQAMKVGGELQLSQRTSIDGPVNLTFAHIAGNLDLTEGSFRKIDLTGATIDSEIRLGSPQHPAPIWAPPQMLVLRNASAGGLPDLPGAISWPRFLDLEGFTYDRLGGSQPASGELRARPVEDFTAWLEKQITHSPQSYIQLARVLRAAGYPDKADGILYAGHIQEMRQATGAQWLLLVLENLVTGYGFKLQNSLYWFAGLIIAGYLIFKTGQDKIAVRNRPRSWFAFTVDNVIPLISLDERHKAIQFTDWRQYFLYALRASSALLAYFVIKFLDQLLSSS
jgi:hypothetical protein